VVFMGRDRTHLVTAEQALPGRTEPLPAPDRHHVLGRSLTPPWPDTHQLAVVGMGCFWGAERIFWQLEGVHTTFAGYAGGHTPNPTYEEVCSGRTGHAEVVAIVHDPTVLSFEALLASFWENHDPTQVMRQGNDVGTQYRSVVLVTGPEQEAIATASRARYQSQLEEAGYGEIATTIEPLGPLYHAEGYHQQYLAKNPDGYCNHGFCQVAY
jgi:peptide-methionine (S)-S-oxide reductase